MAEHIRTPAIPTIPPVEPDRQNIPLPPFAPDLEWIGGEPPKTEVITARGPLLVLFFELGELGGTRTLPLVDRWAAHYEAAGLTVLGVHSPRNDLARSDERLRAGLERAGVGFPVANDTLYRTWHAYECKGWPSLFLWGRGGTLRWFHLGVDGVGAAEEAIREALGAGDEDVALPEPLGLAAQPPAAKLEPPSDEVFPAGSHERAWTPDPGEPLEIEYAGGSAWAALDGTGEVAVTVDRERTSSFEVTAPGLYRLSEHDRHGLHEVSLALEGQIRIWSVSFGPALRR